MSYFCGTSKHKATTRVYGESLPASVSASSLLRGVPCWIPTQDTFLSCSSAPRMSNLERCIALRLVDGAGPRWVLSKNTQPSSHHILLFVPLSRVWCLPVISRVRCLRSVCPALDSQFKKYILVCLVRRKERWPQMVSTQGDFCAHACVHGGQPTVILRAPFTSRNVNAWTCARRSTDRGLESQRAFFVRMLGHVLVGQPTVILRWKKKNAWICAPPTTDPDHANVIFNLNCNNCNACNDCNFSAAALFSI